MINSSQFFEQMNKQQSTLFLLIRTISPYSGADILLGTFAKIEEAKSCKRSYVNQYDLDQKKDPWHKQPYKDIRVIASNREAAKRGR